jgi:hypothetical protein
MMPAHLGARLPKFIKNRQLIHRMKNTFAKDPHCEELPHQTRQLQLPLLPLQQRSLPLPQLALLQQLHLLPLQQRSLPLPQLALLQQLHLLPLQQRSLPMPQLALLQQLPLQPLLQQLSHQALSSKVAQKRYAEAMSLVYWRISVTPRF